MLVWFAYCGCGSEGSPDGRDLWIDWYASSESYHFPKKALEKFSSFIGGGKEREKTRKFMTSHPEGQCRFEKYHLLSTYYGVALA